MGGQLGLQLEAALEAARATEAKRQNEVPRSVAYGGPDESQTKTKRRSLAAAPPIAQPVLVGFPMSYWAVARLEPRREQLALRCLGLAGNETYFPRLREHRISHGRTIEIRPARVAPSIARRMPARSYREGRRCVKLRRSTPEGTDFVTPGVTPSAKILSFRRRTNKWR